MFMLFSIIKRLFAVLISPLCILSLCLSSVLIPFVLIFDIIRFILTGKFNLLNKYIFTIYDLISFGWFHSFLKLLNF